ncbi:MAG: hypothetical protein ACI8XM_002537 [Haloarculaceae archaeon]|jgi:hypothetical protein
MSGFLSGLGGGGADFDSYDEFVPAHLPEPGPFLTDQEVLTGRDHAAVHRLARMLFEDRGVYDVTFGYNLARLNLDRRHTGAGFRYAVERASTEGDSEGESGAGVDAPVLRAEFTPTTEFCPQGDTLAIGAFRAFNGELRYHQFDLVRVRVDETHQESESVNGTLEQLEATFEATGQIRADVGADDASVPTERGTDAPF